MLYLQDTSATCHNLYQVLPLALCADAASTPARYEICDITCPNNSTSNYFEPDPWGAITAQCNSTQQTRTGGLTRKQCLMFCIATCGGRCVGIILPQGRIELSWRLISACSISSGKKLNHRMLQLQRKICAARTKPLLSAQARFLKMWF